METYLAAAISKYQAEEERQKALRDKEMTFRNQTAPKLIYDFIQRDVGHVLSREEFLRDFKVSVGPVSYEETIITGINQEVREISIILRNKAVFGFDVDSIKVRLEVIDTVFRLVPYEGTEWPTRKAVFWVGYEGYDDFLTALGAAYVNREDLPF